MTTTNPLIAQRQDSTTWHTGLQIVDDAASVYDGVSSGNWIEAGLGTLATGMDAVAMATNPIETLISYGLGWLIEHVQPLQDALNWVAGDPDQIAAYAKTWKNVAAAVDQASKDFTTAVNQQAAGWTGAAADAYRQYASGKINALTAAATSANTIGTVVEVVGMVVGMVRWQVRTDVTEAIGEIIQDALEELCTLGLGTPVVIAQVVTLVSDWMANIAELLAKLGSTLAKLRPLMNKLEEIWNAIKELLSDTRSADAVDGAPHDPSVDPAGDTTTPSSAPGDTTTPSSTDPSTTTPTNTDPSTSTTPGTTDPGTTTPSSTDPGTSGDPGAPTTPADPGTPSIGDNNPDPSANSKPADGTPTDGDPVDVSTGVMLQTQTDVDLPGTLRLVVTRTHKSSYRVGRWFGPSWASTLDQKIEIEADAVHFAAADGMLLKYPLPDVDTPVLPSEGAPWPLARTPDGGYTITDRQTGRTLHFAPTGGTRLPITAITDRNHNRIDIDYRSDGTLIGMRHSGGYRIAIDTTDGLITALRLVGDGASQDVTLMRYRYDQRRRLTEVINSSNLPMRFDYDTEGRMTRWEDRNGMWYRFHYDNEGRCVRGEGKDGYLSYTFDYDREGRITRTTNSLGHTTTYQLNERWQVVAETDPIGNTTLSEWDVHHRLLSRTDPLGRQTRYEYDHGDLITVTRPDGSQLRFEYNVFGQPVSMIEPDGATWRREFDERGNLVTRTDPCGARTTYTYDDHGNVVSVVDPLGNTHSVENDPAGLPVTVTDPIGATVRYLRDVFGRIHTVIEPTGERVQTVWSVEGKPVAGILPDGSTERWFYDGEGNLREHVSATGQVSRTDIGHFDQPVRRMGVDGVELRFRYDTELRLVAVTNPLGRAWRYDYDAAGNLVQETDFNDHTVGYRYNAAGELIERHNGTQIIRFDRDTFGRVVRRASTDAITTFEYDVAGRLTRADNADVSLTFVRDPLGRVLAETCNGQTVTSSYDLMGHRVLRHTPSGASSTWEYDTAGQPVALQTAGQSVRFNYDVARREVGRDVGDHVRFTQTWDARRLRTQAVAVQARGGGSRVVQRRSYRYRPDGHVTTIVDQLAGPRDFELDPGGRITAVRTATWSERYAYDKAGNMTFAGWPANSADTEVVGGREYAGTMLRRAGRTRYDYDDRGRIVARRSRTLSGRISEWRYRWDADDRLVGVTTPQGRQWRYYYDALGRRVAKQRLDPNQQSVVERIDFTWDGPQLAEQRSRDNAVAWEWVPGTFRPVSQSERRWREDKQQWTDQQFYAIVTDLIGTPTELVDTDGNIAWHARTSVWGAQVSGIGPAYTPLRFPGHYFDPETQFNYNYHRYYDATTGRYGSADPLGLAPAANPHGYVTNPHRWIDPLGLSPYDPNNPGGKGTQSIWKAPQKGLGQSQFDNGYHAADFPADDWQDGTAYFAKDRQLADNFAASYGDGVIEIQIPQDEYAAKWAQYEYPYDGGPLTELPIPRDVVEQLNQYPRIWHK